MATVEFEGMDDYLTMLQRLEYYWQPTLQKMLNEGAKVVKTKLSIAGPKFAKYLKVKRAKKNEYGWFAQVQFRGTTSSGMPASLAAMVYEHGRGGKNPQHARPFIYKTCKAAEPEVFEKMQDVYLTHLDEVLD